MNENLERRYRRLLALFTAIALTWSPGPSRGKELVGPRGVLIALAGDAAVVLGVWLACRSVRNRRTARRATFTLALPAVAFLLNNTTGSPQGQDRAGPLSTSCSRAANSTGCRT